MVTLPCLTSAQTSKWYRFVMEESWKEPEKKYPGMEYLDSLTGVQQLQVRIFEWYGRGYLLATTSAYSLQDTQVYVFHPGSRFQLRELRKGNVPDEWFSESGLRNLSAGKVLDAGSLFRKLENLIRIASENGYPFASVKLDSLEADSNGLSTSLKLDQRDLIRFDSIGIGGTVRVKQVFLQQYVNIRPGSIYNERLLRNLNARLSELPFVQVVRPPGVYFYGNKAKPYLYLDHRKASSFDGVIGFAPQSSINNKLVITGDLDLKLINLVVSGKNLELLYRGYLNNSQDLRFKFLWPYFLNTRLAVDYSFRLMKFDTTWTELFNDIGLQYRFTGNNYLKFYYQQQQVYLLAADTLTVSRTGSLPAIQDVKNTLYSLGLRWSNLDYFFNPTRGFLVELDAGAGERTIIRNHTLDAVVLRNGVGERYSVYDSVKLSTLRYQFTGDISSYYPISGNLVLKSQVRGAVLVNERMFQNELFRIGGLKTLRGFDEQSIFASRYFIGNLELRYLFQRNSAFLIFWNGAWYRNDAGYSGITDRPWGCGAGMYLETGAGIFSLYYAVGSQRGNPIDLQRARIHFGLVNFF